MWTKILSWFWDTQKNFSPHRPNFSPHVWVLVHACPHRPLSRTPMSTSGEVGDDLAKGGMIVVVVEEEGRDVASNDEYEDDSNDECEEEFKNVTGGS